MLPHIDLPVMYLQVGVCMQPATTHAPLGMRKVKSTSNFGATGQQYAAMHSMHVSMAMPSMTLRASPSMPAFPMSHIVAKEEPPEEPLPHITEEGDDPLRLPENVESMFLDDGDLAQSDDLMNLMKDLHGGAAAPLDMDLGLPDHAPDGAGAGGEMPADAGSAGARDVAAAAAASPGAGPGGTLGVPNAGSDAGAGLEPEPATSAPHSVDVLDPEFFNLDGDHDLGMPLLDDDFTSAFMDS